MTTIGWMKQYDGVLEPCTVYPCAECGYALLTAETSRWKWGVLKERGNFDKGFYEAIWGLILVCADESDCYRRAREVVTQKR